MSERIEYFNSNNDTIKKEIFKYSTFELENNFVNIVYELNRSYITEDVYNLNANEQDCINGVDNMYAYPYRGFKNLLTEKKTIDYLKGVKLENTISYDYNLDNYLPSKQKSLNSRNQEISTEYEYPTNYAKSGVYPYVVMVSEKNWLTPTITQTQKNGGIVVSKNSLEYNVFGSVIAPQKVSKNKGNQNLEKVIAYDKYDNKGNILQYTPENGIPVSIIWGYDKSQPIAKIENATNAQIAAGLGVSDLNTINETDLTDVNNLRTTLPNAMVTTYTHIPLVGVSTITDPKGDIITYTYDSFGRLEFVKDKDGNILSENQYNYKQ